MSELWWEQRRFSVQGYFTPPQPRQVREGERYGRYMYELNVGYVY